MSLTVTCPSCASTLKAPAGAAGRKVKCPKCSAILPVPDEEEVIDLAQLGVRAEAPTREPPPAPRQPRRDDYEDDERDRERRRRRDDFADDDYEYDIRRRRARRDASSGGGLQFGLGIAALCVGILGLFLSWIPFAGALVCGVGLVLGVVAVIVAIGRGQGYGFPIAGSAVSGLALVISVILTVAILAAVQNAAHELERAALQGAVPVGPPTPAAGVIALAGGRGQQAGELTLADPFDRVQRASRCKVFTVVMNAGRTYHIDMLSNPGIMRIDPFLRLEDSVGNNLALDDDGGGNQNARIVFTCPQNGMFRVVATTFLGGTGGFTLRIEER